MFGEHDFELNQFQQYETDFSTDNEIDFDFNKMSDNDGVQANNDYAQFENVSYVSNNDVQISSGSNQIENSIDQQDNSFNLFENGFDQLYIDDQFDFQCDDVDDNNNQPININSQSNSNHLMSIPIKNESSSMNSGENRTTVSHDFTLRQFHYLNFKSSKQNDANQITGGNICNSNISGERFKENYYKHFTHKKTKHARKELVIRYHKLIHFYYPDDIRKINRKEMRDINKYFETFAPMEHFIMEKIREFEKINVIDYQRDYQLLTPK